MSTIRIQPAAIALLTFAIACTAPAISQAAATPADKPSRPAEKGCAWERFSDAKLGLDAWVQRCDFGKRKIDFVALDHALAQRYSDSSGAPELVIGVIDLQPAETPEHGIERAFVARTDRKIAAQCVLTPSRGAGAMPAGVKRYTFVANAAFAKALKAKADPNDVPEPACGAWGDDPDGVQYFQVQPNSAAAHKVLFVRVGQDTPLFDEATLRVR